MYCIYQLENKIMKIIGFENSYENAFEKLKEYVENIIVYEEGNKKLETVWQNSCENMPDGFYLIKNENNIEMYKKTTNKYIENGWITSSEINQNKIDLIKTFGISLEFFDTELKTKQMTNIQNHNQNQTKINLKRNHINKIDMDDIIIEMINNKFKPKNNKKLILNDYSDQYKLNYCNGL